MTQRRISWVVAAGLCVLCVLVIGQAFSQDTGGGAGGGRAWGGGRGFDPNMMRAFDPNSIRKMYADRIKQALGATDEEWTILEPKIEKVTLLRMQMQGGGMGMMIMGMFGRPGAEPSDLMKAQQALAQVLAKKDAAPGDINDALKALRAAKAKAKVELEKAQAELKEVLTLRQEAQLVQMGTMD